MEAHGEAIGRGTVVDFRRFGRWKIAIGKVEKIIVEPDGQLVYRVVDASGTGRWMRIEELRKSSKDEPAQ